MEEVSSTSDPLKIAVVSSVRTLIRASASAVTVFFLAWSPLARAAGDFGSAISESVSVVTVGLRISRDRELDLKEASTTAKVLGSRSAAASRGLAVGAFKLTDLIEFWSDWDRTWMVSSGGPLGIGLVSSALPSLVCTVVVLFIMVIVLMAPDGTQSCCCVGLNRFSTGKINLKTKARRITW
jgi:hypothetical protein